MCGVDRLFCFLKFCFKVCLVLFGVWNATIVAGQAAQCTLQWQASPDVDVIGYKVYYHMGPSAPPYTGTGAKEGESPIQVSVADVSDPVTGEGCQFTVSGLDEFATYYFVVSAYDDQNNESGFSNEVCLNAKYKYECRLTPKTTRVWSSGLLEFEVRFTNNTGRFQYFLFATDITTPSGNNYPEPYYLLGPVWIYLPPYGSMSKQVSHTILENANPGLYTYHAYVGQLGTGIHQEDRFIFEVLW